MCVICDGGSQEELLADEFVRIALHGFVMVQVAATPTWTYTIGLLQSFAHPELVITGVADEAAHLLVHVVDRIRDGERFDAERFDGEAAPLSPLCGTTVGFRAVHPAQWDAGRFDQWLRYYDWVHDEPPTPEAIQVLWPDREGRFPPDPRFCPEHRGTCQPLFDDAPRHHVNSGDSRERRRRRTYGHGKRRRQ